MGILDTVKTEVARRVKNQSAHIAQAGVSRTTGNRFFTNGCEHAASVGFGIVAAILDTFDAEIIFPRSLGQKWESLLEEIKSSPKPIHRLKSSDFERPIEDLLEALTGKPQDSRIEFKIRQGHELVITINLSPEDEEHEYPTTELGIYSPSQLPETTSVVQEGGGTRKAKK